MMKCNKCGKELPEDSKFCQYCGSSEIEKIELKKIAKYCNNCKKQINENDKFCPYCGSDYLIDEETFNKANSIDNRKDNHGSKTAIIVLCILLAVVSYLAIYNYNNANNNYNAYLEEVSKYDDLYKRYTNVNNQLTTYKTKSSKYDQIFNYSMNANYYSDAFAKTTIVYSPSNEVVPIYWNRGSETVWCESYNCTAEWTNSWNSRWTGIKISSYSGQIGYVRIYNKSLSRSFYITVIG